MVKTSLKKAIQFIFGRYINLPLISHLVLRPIRPNLKDMDDTYRKFRIDGKNTKSCDLGCGFEPSNGFNADEVYGIDLYENPASNVLKCRLGYEKLPFEDGSIDYLVASNILEHIPRISSNSEKDHYPFIFLMNECYPTFPKWPAVWQQVRLSLPSDQVFCALSGA